MLPQEKVKCLTMYYFCHLVESTLWQYPRLTCCDFALCFPFSLLDFPLFLAVKFRSGDCGGKATQASSACSSLDFKQAWYTGASMHVQDQYPAGKWILFHTYYRARRGSMPLQNKVVFLSLAGVELMQCKSLETAPQLNISTIKFDCRFSALLHLHHHGLQGLEYASAL